MEPHADVRIRPDPDWSPWKYPEPQCHIVDFRSGERVSEAAAHLILAIRDGLARLQPWQITDIQAAVDPKDPTILNCSYKIVFPRPFIMLSFVIDTPKEKPMEYPLAECDGGCRVPGCGRARGLEFNVQVSTGTAENGHCSQFVRGASCAAPGHRAYIEAAYRESYLAGGPADPVLVHDLFGRLRQHGDELLQSTAWTRAISGAGPVAEPPNPFVAAAGATTTVDRADHKHDVSTAAREALLTVVAIKELAKKDDLVAAIVSSRLPCECGSEKTGLPTHSSWCPKALS